MNALASSPADEEPRRTLIRAFAEALPAAVEGADPEAVHQVRSSALRLSVAMELRAVHALRPDLAWLRGELRRARDLDVALERDLPASLREHWSAERAAEQRRVCAAIRSPRVLGLAVGAEAALARLAARPAPLERRLKRLQRRANLAQRTQEPEPLHSVRKGLRRVRLGLAEFGIKVRDAGGLVSELGAVGDARAFGELLAELPSGVLATAEREHLADLAAREERLRARHALSLVDARVHDLVRRARKSLRRVERAR